MKRFVTHVLLFSIIISALSIPSYADGADDNMETMIIDGIEYTADSFFDRVLEFTHTDVTLDEYVDLNGSKVYFEYENGLRVSKKTDSGITTYVYDDANRLIRETKPDGVTVDYNYQDSFSNPLSFSVDGIELYYFYDDEGTVSGLGKKSGKLYYKYQYGDTCETSVISEGLKLENVNVFDDYNYSELNSIRYRNYIYDTETNLYYIIGGGYYSPSEEVVIGEETHLDLKGLWGDRYKELTADYFSSKSANNVDVYNLTYAASQFYENGISQYSSKYTKADWYKNFKGSKQYYLIARVIYAENTNKVDNDPNMRNMLKYNRQGVGWGIINRYYEDLYRYEHSYKLYFSEKGSAPSYYSVLLKGYSSIKGNNAKAATSSSNVAYQEAFWIASCIKVCDTFEKINAVLAHPLGVDHHCYNKGMIKASSAPNSNWASAVFPGYATNFAGKKNYKSFPYNCEMLNIIHDIKGENLFIDSEYYGK